MKKIIRIDNLCCPSCGARIENDIKKINGVQNCTVSFLAQKIVIEADDCAIDDILGKISTIVKNTEPDAELHFE